MSRENLQALKALRWRLIKIFWEEGGGGWEGGSSKRCLKLSGGGGIVKGSFQNRLKQGVGKGKSCS